MKDFFNKNKFHIGIIISMFIWGVSWPSGKIVSTYGNATDIVFIRFVIVFITLLVLLISFKISLKIKFIGWKHILASGILMAMYSYFFLTGVKNGMAGAGGVLVTTLNPIFAFSIGLFLNKRLPQKNEIIGLFIGVLAGCILLKVWEDGNKIFDSGNIFFLSASLVWAIMSKITSKGTQFGDSSTFSLYLYAITVLVLALFINVNEIENILHISDTTFWINIAFNGALSTSICTTFYFYATTRIGAENASSYIFLVPLSAAISSFILLDETIKLNTIIGGILGIIAVYVINKKTIK